jgi:DNA-binding transcriptional LysR family regulator
MEAGLLRSMVFFVAVAKSMSFSKAAKVLGLPNSTLSRHISGLEQSLGVRLINRTTRSVALTIEGQAYLERAQRIVEDATTAHEEVRQHTVLPRGHLRISMTVDFAVFCAAPWLTEFVKKYPELTLDVDTSPSHVDLIADRVDVALRFGDLPDSGLIVRQLSLMARSLYAAPDYLKKQGIPEHPSELEQHQCIRLSSKPTRETWCLSKEKEKINFSPKESRFWFNSYGLAQRFALEGLGIAALADPLCVESVATGRLVRVLPLWQLAPLPFSALTTARLLPAKTRAFIDFLAEKLKPEPKS